MSSTKDHFAKPLSNEQKFSQTQGHINQIYKILGDINTRLIALSVAKIEPKVLASFIRDTEKCGNFMKNLNSQLDLAAAQEAKEQNDKLKAFAPPVEEK